MCEMAGKKPNIFGLFVLPPLESRRRFSRVNMREQPACRVTGGSSDSSAPPCAPLGQANSLLFSSLGATQ